MSRTHTALFQLIPVAAVSVVLLIAHTTPLSAQDADKKAAADSARQLLNELESAVQRAPMKRDANVEVRPEDGPGQPLIAPEDRAAANGLLDTSLTVDYGLNRIWNVKQQKPVTVRLRSYEGTLVGPTLRVRPGDMLRVNMINNLPPNKPHHGDINEPHGFNTTNLHTHGLHVSPSGNSDNILVSIEPKQRFQNEIYIPPGHPPGTFWYHAHVHGSTTIQVASGMTGALIVEGGLDDVPEIAAAKDQLFVLQQAPYVKADDADFYEIENYNQFGPQAWKAGVITDGWRTAINGQTQPSLHLYPGELQRWRFVHAGQREAVDLCLLRYEDAKELVKKEGVQREDFLKKSVPLFEVAADGLAFGFKWKRRHVGLFPGYRSDVLVRLDRAGTYVLFDLAADAGNTMHEVDETTKLLAIVRVNGSQGPVMPLPRDRDLLRYRPHRSVTDEEVTEHGEMRVQRLRFHIGNGFRAGDPGPNWDKPVQPFGKNGVRELQLGMADEWTIDSTLANHPYHIHVNPFEIVHHPQMVGEDQPKDETGRARTIWKDTIIVPDINKIVGDDESKKRVRIRTRYERYIGTFVLHCHILEHEDQGMMQLVRIVGPGKGHDGHGSNGH
jgi:FtsP/CotA-like multicopper oxidase with cupredoxin domain